tara:strand:- start:437 stop:616 length:180 start_codon:yes stop_codon:yes gene_type:complete
LNLNNHAEDISEWLESKVYSQILMVIAELEHDTNDQNLIERENLGEEIEQFGSKPKKAH